MAWGFEADCPDCRHRWEGVERSFHVGPQPPTPAHSRELFCPRCYRRVFLPRVVDRKSWRVWRDRFLAEGPPPEWVPELLVRIDAELATGGWYVPRRLDPGTVDCAGCGSPLVPGGTHVTCPACDSPRPVRPGCTSHISLVVGEDGFS